ncbi:Aurofusarin cluster transcription factor aurR2 [Colletotrichum spinosum]|uniref:Aurofusarin cluster transcription factor aurR2 n=1 Tax=Colletotrichum spinosum TaxID=1347390 RepID=A0A4V3HS03_9PEZI|nr:Aurofusarin cluster transcription factor aurR2 [Colletotrichum spinosum]
MRKHNVDFSPPSQTWVQYKVEAQPDGSVSTSLAPFATAATRPSSEQPLPDNITRSQTLRPLWFDISPELKHPPIQGLCHKNDPLLHAMPPLHVMSSGSSPDLNSLHPEPRQIFRLWQVFIEKVAPLLKIVHVPTLQQRILDASWDVGSASSSLRATMFAVYTQSVTALSPEECHGTLNESRETLLTRYRTATFRALVEAEFLTTRDFEVLTALVLFLFANPTCDLTTTLTTTAIKLGKKMGLHRNSHDATLPFLEQEMRVRLWWQLNGLEARNRMLNVPEARTTPSKTEFGDVRMPLNVNDADLHPEMTEAPVEHSGPTEMMGVMMKYEVFNWMRSSPAATQVFEAIAKGRGRDKLSIETYNKALGELGALFEDKYSRHLDRRIPLHNLTWAMARLMLTRMRFKMWHPKMWGVGERDGVMSQEDGDELFELAVTWAELMEEGMNSKFALHLFMHMMSMNHIRLDAYIYIISDLRERTSGERVSQAWKMVERFYNDHPELIADGKDGFIEALGQLTLLAWENRRKELVIVQGHQEADVTPRFIAALWEKRDEAEAKAGQTIDALDGVWLAPDGNLDWDQWSAFLTF